MGDDATATIAIRNQRHSAEEELIIEQHGGRVADLPDRVREVADEDVLAGLDQGDWITVVDGEVVATGHAHPFSVRADL